MPKLIKESLAKVLLRCHNERTVQRERRTRVSNNFQPNSIQKGDWHPSSGEVNSEHRTPYSQGWFCALAICHYMFNKFNNNHRPHCEVCTLGRSFICNGFEDGWPVLCLVELWLAEKVELRDYNRKLDIYTLPQKCKSGTISVARIRHRST